MREVSVKTLIDPVARLCRDANLFLGEDVVTAFKKFRDEETSAVGKEVLTQLLENADIARHDEEALCQDTGFAVFFIDVGQDVHFVDGEVLEAVHEGVRRGYKDGYLRTSIVGDPLRRVNTKDNTPAVVHWRFVPGDKVTIRFAAKGGGSENMSGVRMLKPADGVEGVKKFVVERVSEAGSNPCPPIVVGVGIGGTFEVAATLAKKALFRKIGERHPDPFYAKLEQELLAEVNKLGIGPAGFGGRTTALDVFVETFPCHIASLPVAVNINCHSARHMEVVI